MRYLALCCDYDGTLATEGQVMPETIAAVERLIAARRRVVLVTGRELDELKTVCPRLDLFEYVVAENGALLYQPSSGTETPLAKRPPDAFVAALHAQGVARISVGRVIVATWEPHETTVLETIKAQGLELQVIFNKGAVMILPAGVNKASGLAAALERMTLSAHNAVGIGDAENDHALLALCECGVAVANALPTLKKAADFVTTGARGAGVAELIAEMLKDDLASHEPALARHHIVLGWDCADREVSVRPYGENLLLVGTSGSGKSTLAAELLARLSDSDYTFCVVDPEGGYESLQGAVALGATDRPPSVEEILKLFRSPDQSGVINVAGLPAGQRKAFFGALLPRLAEQRSHTGRPHWLVIDSAKAPMRDYSWVAPNSRERALAATPPSVLQITDNPNLCEASALADVNLLVVMGNSPQQMIQEFCRMTQKPTPHMDPVTLRPGEALAWRAQEPKAAPFRLRIKR